MHVLEDLEILVAALIHPREMHFFHEAILLIREPTG
jgi:hypothetical protein